MTKEGVIYPCRVSKGLVTSLLKFSHAIKVKGENKIHLQREVGLTHNEYCNFQKLRYHDLAVQSETSGYWELTYRGLLFCLNALAVPIKVWTQDNIVVGVSDELTYASDVLNDTDTPHWDKIEDYKGMYFLGKPSLNTGEQLQLF
jgi:hypothetical protein